MQLRGRERSEDEVHVAEYLWQLLWGRGRIAFCCHKERHVFLPIYERPT